MSRSGTNRTPEQRRAWRANNRGSRCSRCWSSAPLPGLSRCSWCSAKDRERDGHLRAMRHDTDEHAKFLEMARRADSECAASGVVLWRLAEHGQRLEVDRIDSRRGYVRGNMQLIARRLNRWKQAHGDRLPPLLVKEFREMCERDLSVEARIMGGFDSPGGRW